MRARSRSIAFDHCGIFHSNCISGYAADLGRFITTGKSVVMNLPKSAAYPEMQFEWKIPQWSNAIERDRARIYFVAYAAAMAFHFLDKAFAHVRSGDLRVF